MVAAKQKSTIDTQKIKRRDSTMKNHQFARKRENTLRRMKTKTQFYQSWWDAAKGVF